MQEDTRFLTMITFAIFGLFFPGIGEEGSQVKGLESEFGKSYFIHMIPGQVPVRKKFDSNIF